MTKIYVKGAPEFEPPPPPPLAPAAPIAVPRGTPRMTPVVRSFEVSNHELAALARSSARRHDRTLAIARRTSPAIKVAFGGACVVIGIVIGGVVAFRSDGRASAAVAAPAAPIVAPKPIVVPVPVAPAPAPKPARATIRIESEPAGATAMLVDDGKTMLLGKTPIDTDVELSRTYDIVFTLEDREPRVERFDPSSTNHVMVELQAPAPAPESAPEPTPVPTRAPIGHAPAKHAKRAAVRAAVVERAPAASAATGTLLVSSKPPCAIVIDGKRTGLTTPQRALALPVGSHEVTLTNAEQGIHLTTMVEITADKATKLIRDFTD